MHGRCASTTQFAELFSINNPAIIETEGLLESGYEKSFNKNGIIPIMGIPFAFSRTWCLNGETKKTFAAPFLVKPHSETYWQIGGGQVYTPGKVFQETPSKVSSYKSHKIKKAKLWF